MLEASEAEGFMRRAIQLAQAHMEAGEGGPFGAVVVKGGQVVGEGWNRVTSQLDPTAHAEVTAIRAACRALGTFDLAGCELLTSCEPCPMCLAAAYWARLERIWYAATQEDAAAIQFDDAWLYHEIPLAPEDRSLPAVPLLREEALRVFRAWEEKPDKIRY